MNVYTIGFLLGSLIFVIIASIHMFQLNALGDVGNGADSSHQDHQYHSEAQLEMVNVHKDLINVKSNTIL